MESRQRGCAAKEYEKVEKAQGTDSFAADEVRCVGIFLLFPLSLLSFFAFSDLQLATGETVKQSYRH